MMNGEAPSAKGAKSDNHSKLEVLLHDVGAGGMEEPTGEIGEGA